MLQYIKHVSVDISHFYKLYKMLIEILASCRLFKLWLMGMLCISWKHMKKSTLLLEWSSGDVPIAFDLLLLVNIPTNYTLTFLVVSGLSGSRETAQNQVLIGMGLLAGSTVMLLTVL